MPQTKTKPAATAQPTQPETPPSGQEQQAAIRWAEKEAEKCRLQALGELIAAISDHPMCRLEMLRTFETIMDRERGCTTPVEAFIESLVMHYGFRDKEGKGLTIEDVNFQMNQHAKEEDLRETLETAYFLTDRYARPRPEAEGA